MKRRKKKEKIGRESHVREMLMRRYRGRKIYVGSGASVAPSVFLMSDFTTHDYEPWVFW
jgi:hypothetical protein